MTEQFGKCGVWKNIGNTCRTTHQNWLFQTVFSIYGSECPANQFVFGKIIMEISFKFLRCIHFGCFGHPILRSRAWPLFPLMVSGHASFGHNRSMEQKTMFLTCQPSQPSQPMQLNQDLILFPIQLGKCPIPQKCMSAIDCTLKDRNVDYTALQTQQDNATLPRMNPSCSAADTCRRGEQLV